MASTFTYRGKPFDLSRDIAQRHYMAMAWPFPRGSSENSKYSLYIDIEPGSSLISGRYDALDYNTYSFLEPCLR